MKGRKFVPSTRKDGCWFPTLSAQGRPASQERHRQTITAPEKFERKLQARCTDHVFSEHDNRYALEGDGEHFKMGFGRRKHKTLIQLPSLLSWNHNPLKTSFYSSVYREKAPSAPAEYCRFPSTYPKPMEGLLQLRTTPTTWFNDTYFTSFSVLAQTQKPRLGPNNWRYSYKAPRF